MTATRRGATVRRPVLRYHGSKWLAAPWILSQFPEHHCYVELFGGGGALLLRKRPSPIEVYNDADGEIVNFFRVLREKPKRLVDLLALTPYARSELHLAYERAKNPVEQARRTFVRMWQGHGGNRAGWKTGWRYQRTLKQRASVVADWQDHERLLAVAARLSLVQIECSDAVEIVRRYDTPDTLFYADPPYVADTRSERWRGVAYGAHEFDDADHARLAEVLGGIQGMAMVSGYPSPLYEGLYAGWTMTMQTVAVDRRSHRSENKTQGRRVEALWISPSAMARGRQPMLMADAPGEAAG